LETIAGFRSGRDHAPAQNTLGVELWNEEEKALAHVHGFSRQHFIQLGAERFQPYKPVDPRKKVSRLYPFPPARGNIKEAFPLQSALK
jgi:hypothetical protein